LASTDANAARDTANDAARDAVVLATRSGGKVRELRALFAVAGIGCMDVAQAGVSVDPREDSIERFLTFEENARAKAEWFSARLSGRLVFAEDSGLEVRALGGAPGVHSKRWSGSAATLAGDALDDALDDANNVALMRAMHGVTDRSARYACVAVLMRDGRELAITRGVCEGRIAELPRGNGGFGYDPLFQSEELGQTFGQASPEDKSRVSHRARAVRAMIEAIRRVT
jgi:XTP/dITP diphosphohydrolase